MQKNKLFHFYIFVFIFSIIFGPKILLIIDTSILIPFLLIVPILKTINLNRNIYLFLMFIAYIILHQSIIQLINQNLNLLDTSRLLRSFIQIIIISIFINFVKKKISLNKLINILLLTLFIHSVLIIIASFYDPLNLILGNITGNIRIRHFRASGLLTGFDIAGMISLIGMAIILFSDIEKKFSFKFFFYILTFAISTVFNSRMTMAFAVILFLLYIIKYIHYQKNRILAGIILFSLLSLIGFYFKQYIDYLLLLVDYTFHLGIFEISNEEYTFLSKRFSANSATGIIDSMYFLPSSGFKIIFGTGTLTEYSDIGYIKHIFRIGILGTLLMVAGYTFFVFRIIKNKYTKSLLLSVILLILIFSFKNDYFFVRGVFPLFIIIAYFYISFNQLSKYKKKYHPGI